MKAETYKIGQFRSFGNLRFKELFLAVKTGFFETQFGQALSEARLNK